ncbi:Hypothetical protein FKW44_022889 [Caligus rogercresseyi]|uniref:Uncharacterized protein n=1 Tax=Caligus rogercresseyi TaxID=217165 RepID=A0A7T8GNJ6_CALRO|nr:Hypothetical protein FKW44_022889 [Caligus rogercresseyi]
MTSSAQLELTAPPPPPAWAAASPWPPRAVPSTPAAHDLEPSFRLTRFADLKG